MLQWSSFFKQRIILKVYSICCMVKHIIINFEDVFQEVVGKLVFWYRVVLVVFVIDLLPEF